VNERLEKVFSCLICKRSDVDGIFVAANFICEDCERRIVSCESSDPDYDELLQSIRLLWRPYGSIGELSAGDDSSRADRL